MLACCCAFGQSDTNPNSGEVSLSSARLPAQVRNDIVAAIAKDFSDQPKDVASGSKIALGSWVSFVQLSLTGAPAILITAGPDDPYNGATGNGDLWLFRRIGNRAVLVLKGGGAGFTRLRGTYHNGMLDVQTAWNMSCCSGGVEVYRFDGVRYKPSYCYSYATDEDGNMKDGPHGRCRD